MVRAGEGPLSCGGGAICIERYRTAAVSRVGFAVLTRLREASNSVPISSATLSDMAHCFSRLPTDLSLQRAPTATSTCGTIPTTAQTALAWMNPSSLAWSAWVFRGMARAYKRTLSEKARRMQAAPPKAQELPTEPLSDSHARVSASSPLRRGQESRGNPSQSESHQQDYT